MQHLKIDNSYNKPQITGCVFHALSTLLLFGVALFSNACASSTPPSSRNFLATETAPTEVPAVTATSPQILALPEATPMPTATTAATSETPAAVMPAATTTAAITEDAVTLTSTVPLTVVKRDERIVQIGRGRIEYGAWSPDGKWIALATSLGIYLYDSADLTTGRFLSTPHRTNVVAFSADSALLAADEPGSGERRFTIWDVREGRKIGVIPHIATTSSTSPRFALSADGRRIAFGNRRDIEVWDIPSGQLLYTLSGHQDRVLSLSFSPDGSRLASGARDRQVILWDLTNTPPVQSFAVQHPDIVFGVAFGQDGKWVASGGRGSGINLWDVATGQLSRTVPAVGGSLAIAVSPGGTLVASGSEDRSVEVLDIASSERRFYQAAQPSYANALAFNPDASKLLIVRSGDSTAEVVSLKGSETLARASGHLNQTWRVAWSRDGAQIYAHYPAGITVWDTRSGQKVQDLSNERLEFSPSLSRTAQFNDDGSVILDSGGGVTHTLRVTGNIIGDIEFSGDERLIAVGSSDGSLSVWDVATGAALWSQSVATDGLRTVAFSPNGSRIVFYSGISDFSLRLWDVERRRQIAVLTDSMRIQGGRFTDNVKFAPDSRIIVAGDITGTIAWWNAENGQRIGLARMNSVIVAIAFSPDGSLVAAGDRDGGISLWDVRDKEAIRCLKMTTNDSATTNDPSLPPLCPPFFTDHTDVVRSLAFSPDGSLLASGSHDGTIRFWDVPVLSR